MAGETGFGYGIDISALDKSIVAADAHLKGLATTAEKTMGRINNAFAKGVSGGISMFIKEISKANSELVQLSQKGIGFEFNPLSSGKGSKFYASVMNDVNNIMAQTRKQLEDLNKYKLKDIIDPKTSLNSIKQLEARLQTLQTSLSTGTVGGKAIGSNQRKAYADEIAAIQERLKVLRMSTAEFNRLKSEEAAALLRNAQVEEETNARRIKEQQRFLQEQRRQATERAKAGDTTAHALKYTDRIFSDKGLRSINNMNRAISMMQDAQRKLNLNTEDGRQKYAQLETRIRQVKKAIDEATGSSNKLKKAHTSLMDISGQLARKMALVFSVSQITGYIRKLVEVRGEFELQQKALQAIVQNVDEANKLWEKTVALAVKSPFRVKELVTYTKQLAAYRVETDKLYDTTKMLADVSAGLGVDMQRLILAYGQVKAANYLRGTELRQFSEAGINILGELAKYFTELEGRVISVGDVFERVSKRMVTFGDVEEIFKRITSEGGVFYNMQELQAETVKGQMSNLRDSIDIMLNDIGKANDGTIKGLIKAARNVVENWEEFAVTLKTIVPLFLALHAQSKLSAIGLKNAGDASLWFHKGLNTTVGAASKATLSLKGLTFQQKLYATASFLGVKATAALQTALVGLGSVLKTIAPFLIVAALVEIYKAMTKASREAKRLQKSLDGIFAEDTSKLNSSIDRYGDLVTRLREANAGSKERRDIISKLNNEYGQYLDFVVTEQTSVDKLADSYDILVKRMKEKAAINTYEKGAQEIEDSYGKALKNAKEEFYELFEGGSVRMKGNDLSAAFKTIIPTKDEIDDIYSLLQQKINSLSSEQMDSLGEQQQLIQGIVAGYYGEEFFLSRDYAKSIELINILVDKKRLEEELQAEINAQYKQTLKSRKANLAYAKLEQDYELQQNEIRATKGLSDFEVQKRLNKIKEEFELNKIKLQFEFGAISKNEFNEQRNALLNWASDTTKEINNEIRRNLSNFMSEEEWSNFLITPDKQAQGMSEIIKEITDGYASQTSEIERQLSLKSAGRKYDEKGLEFAQKQAKAYEVIADIMGIELKKQERMSEALREQINELLPTKHKISLEDAYKGVKDIQKETSNEYKAQVEVIEMLIAQKRAGVVIDGESLETAREDLEILREKMKLLGMKVDEPMSETTRNSINYFLPEEFKISEAEALKGIVAVNSEAASAFEKAQKEYDVLIKMQDQQVEGLEDEILLLESQLPYLQRKVELTGTEIKDRLSELQLLEINAQLSEEYQLDEINLYKDRSTLISEIQSKEQSVANAIRSAQEMRKEGLTIEDGYIEKLEEEYLAHKAILDLIDPSTEEPIDRQKVYDINSKLDKDYQIDVVDSQKNEVTLLRDANTEKEKAIAYEAQLLAMKDMGVSVSKEELALAKKEIEQWTLRWKLLGGTEEQKKNGSESLMDERIKVVDDMNKAYKDLNQTLSKTESLEGAFAKYKDAFQKAYAGTTLLPKNFGTMTATQFLKEFNFTTEDGMIGFFDKLIKYAKKTSERVDVELAKGDYIMETKVAFQKDADEKLYREIDEMFDEYDLSLELKELNLPPDVAKTLFDIDTVSLDALKEKVTDSFMGIEFYSERIKDAGEIMEDTFNGNVDLLNRKLIPAQDLASKGWKDVGDGVATVFSSSYSVTDASGKNVDILVTPILPDGTVMSEKELEDYISKKIEGAEDVLKADDKGVIIHAGVEMEDGLGEYLHSLQEVFYASDMLSEDQKAKYQEFIDRINDMEEKAQVERLETYLKYTRAAIGERAKIKVEEMTKLQEIEETFQKAAADAKTEEDKKRIEEQKKLAIAGVQKESSDKTNKLDWDAFRSSETFISLFNDLDNASDALLNHAIAKIREFQEQWTDMPISDAKEMINKLNELELALLDTGKPFEDYRKANIDIENAMLARNIEPRAKSAKSQEELRDKIGVENKDMEDIIARAQLIESTLQTINNAVGENKAEQLALVGINKDYVESLGLSETVLTNTAKQNNDIVNDEKDKAAQAGRNIAQNNKILKQLDTQEKRLQEQAEALDNAKKMANDLYDAFKSLTETLVGDDPAMIFADMGMNMANTVLDTIMLQIQLNAATVAANGLGAAMNTAMGVIGWIVMAIQLLVQGIMAAVNYAEKMRQMKLDVLAGQVDNLKQKYDALAESIDKAYSTKQLQEYSKEIEKVQAKMEDAQRDYIALLESGKDGDTIDLAKQAQKKLDNGGSVDNLSKKERKALLSEEYQDYKEATDALAEMQKDREEQKQDLLDSMGGVTDYKSVAQEFVDAWVDAFQETGDGLSGLQENFREFFDNVIKQEAMRRVTDKYMQPFFDDLNAALESESSLSEGEIADLKAKADKVAPELSKVLEELWIALGGSMGETSGGLSALQKGIQGLTEDTGQIIESYLNSVRFYVESISRDTASQLTEVKAMHKLLDSVVLAGHPKGRSGIKVFMD